jgi:hypothetical protein
MLWLWIAAGSVMNAREGVDGGVGDPRGSKAVVCTVVAGNKL